MPVTDDILERTRHLNDLKSMAEKTILPVQDFLPDNRAWNIRHNSGESHFPP